MTKNRQLYRTRSTPRRLGSRYPLIVVDGSGLTHLPLTQFYQLTQQFLADGTTRTYLQTLLPYFTYLTADVWRCQRGDQWDSKPEAVRESRDYLIHHLHCKARPHDTYELVLLTGRSPSTVRIFLSALKQFYTIARRSGWYPYAHPLINSSLLLLQEVVAEDVSVRPGSTNATSKWRRGSARSLLRITTSDSPERPGFRTRSMIRTCISILSTILKLPSSTCEIRLSCGWPTKQAHALVNWCS